MAQTAMSAAELDQFLYDHFPELEKGTYHIEEVASMSARVRMHYHSRHLRPGGTISGAALMNLADMVMYVAVLGMIGPEAMTVTTNLNINFLRKPPQRDVIAECRILKLGKRLAVGDVKIYSDGLADVVAHAAVTYSIPPR
ncbi:MAG TPA: PaaI family thioesterase [Blastocatellia bacterium]